MTVNFRLKGPECKLCKPVLIVIMEFQLFDHRAVSKYEIGDLCSPFGGCSIGGSTKYQHCLDMRKDIGNSRIPSCSSFNERCFDKKI